MKNAWKAAALCAALVSPAWAADQTGHAGSRHPAEAVRDTPPANIATKPALPPGVQPSTHKVHAGHEHPAIEGHDHAAPSATETKPALPPGVKP